MAVGLLLLLGPLWAWLLPITGTTYEYERVEVVADNGTLQYEQFGHAPASAGISEDIACERRYERACTLEAQLADEGTLPTGVSGSRNMVESRTDERYQYVELDDGVYETVFVENETGSHYDIALEPASAQSALDDVAVSPDADAVPGVVAEAARDGSATAQSEVADPGTPIKVDGGYYRVFASADDERTVPEQILFVVLVFVTPGAGLFLVLAHGRRLSVTVDVSYEADRERYRGPEWGDADERDRE